MLSKPNRKSIINYAISIIAFIWISVMIVKQLKQQDQLHEAYLNLTSNWTQERIILLSVVFVLMLCNWSVEAIKWRLLLKPLQAISLGRSLRSVLTGISISLLTPNGIGEYAGRIIYLKDVNKLKGITANMVSSFAQFIAASIFGIAGCIFYIARFNTEWYLPYVLAGSILVVILLLLFYFRLDNIVNWLEKFTLLQKVSEYMQVVKTYESGLLIRIIIFSALRYFIFAMQYYILLHSFLIHIHILPALLSVFLIFWLMAIIPTIALAEIPVRTEMSYRILQVFTSNALGVMSASIFLWLINLIIPALIGGIVLIGTKFSNKE